jgi:anti-sigma B factor antagonist
VNESLDAPVFGVMVDTDQHCLALIGELDVAGVPLVRAGGTQLLTAGAGIVVDLARLTFIDAAGLGVLVELSNALRAGHHELTITQVSPRVARTFAVAGLVAMVAA